MDCVLLKLRNRTTATFAPTPTVLQILAEFHSTDQSYSTFLVSIWELRWNFGRAFRAASRVACL